LDTFRPRNSAALQNGIYLRALPPFEKQSTKTSNQIVGLSKSRAAFLQLLALYHKDAANIVKKYPIAQQTRSPHMNYWQQEKFIKHNLIPTPKPTPVN
jgi:hypothetical protein